MPDDLTGVTGMPQRKPRRAFLVCARATDPLTVQGASFEHRCGTCGERVMVAPVSHRLLNGPEPVEIICMPCHLLKHPAADVRYVLPADAKTVIRELKTTIPNTWRQRN